MSLNIAVVYGSVREGRQGIKAAKFIVNTLKEKGHTVTLIDPLESELPFFNKSFKSYGENEAPENLKKLSKQLSDADGFIVVSAEYNHNIPPALTNLMSHFGDEYKRKPAGIVSYSSGPFGGIRASIAMREFLAAIGIVAIPTIFPVSKVETSFDDEGKSIDESYPRRIIKFFEEFEWFANALRNEREKDK